MPPPLTISIVTPSLNQSALIEATLRSVVDQSYPSLEYVVIDGGSSDGSVDVIRAYESKLTYWESQPDRGHAHALNKGFAMTRGEVMAWINSSDLYYPWTLATVGEVFSELPDVEWITGVPTLFSTDGGPRSVGRGRLNVYDVLAGNYRWLQQESVFWRRTLWERAGASLNEELRCAADFDLWLRFWHHAPLYHLDTILAGFRSHENRLGKVEDDLYVREAESLFSAFGASFDTRVRMRATMVRLLAKTGGQVAPKALRRLGRWPWYSHPRIVYDFRLGRWTVRE